ncbi:MAG: right-handed parallel beta-helix repeat-containing protein [bacterium]|nr:right-handed parallel beta-helix repeat-containing protein [bacterium]
MYHFRLVLLAALLLLPLAPAHSEEGRIPIFEPTTLTASGKYVVTRDIVPGGPQPEAIIVAGTGSELVEIDLNGFTLTSQLSAGANAISAGGVRKLTIRNGTIATEAGDPSCISATGGSGRTSVIIEDVVGTCGTQGITLVSWKNITVRRSSIEAFDGAALAITGAVRFQGIIEQNLLAASSSMSGPAALDVVAPSAGLQIVANEIDAGGGGGIAVQSSEGLLVAANAVGQTAGAGIYVNDSEGCRVRNNSVVETSNAGFLFVDVSECMIVDNVSRGNTGDGMAFLNSDRNHVDRNLIGLNGFGGNPAYGLYFNSSSDDNPYGRNTSTGNNPSWAFTCPASPNASCGASDLCDQGTGNKTFGDNLVPGPPPC